MVLQALYDARIAPSLTGPIGYRRAIESGQEIKLTSVAGGFECDCLPVGTSFAFLSTPRSDARLVTTTEIDIDLVQYWTTRCEHQHAEKCAAPHLDDTGGRRGFSLRAIDVYQMCIVDLSEQEEYVALSYVWGGVPAYRLLKSNVYTLMEWGGLIEEWSKIPQTIRDAIQLTQRMGRRYLWVDSLCLIQDDYDDMKLGVNSMGDIYEQSFLAIVAANASESR